MRRPIIAFILGALLGTAVGLAIGLLVFPFVFAPPPATESLAPGEQTRVVAQGQFIHADPSDPVHYGKGGVTVYDKVVFLGPDFEVGPGPAYHVYLVPRTGIKSSADVGTDVIDLGRLRSFAGSQKYAIPAGTTLGAHQSVVIWCKAFGVLISPAELVLASN